MEKTLLLPLTLESRFLCFLSQPLPFLPSERDFPKPRGPQPSVRSPGKHSSHWRKVWRFGSTHPCFKPAKHWALGVYEQLFAVKWQHLFTCFMLWPWNTLPKESSSVISNLPRHFIFPTASNSINRQLITITISPQEVRPHKSNFKPLLSYIHLNVLHPKHSRHFSTKCLRCTQRSSSHPKGRRNC